MTDVFRIAQVSPYGLDRYGGVRSHILGLGEALAVRGHRVEVVAPGADGMLGSLPVIGCGEARAIHFGGTHFDLTWASAQSLNRVAAREYDIVHLHTPWTPAMPLQLATRFRGRGFVGARVGTFHDVASATTPRLARVLMPFASALIRRNVLHATIAVSPSVSAYLGKGTHDLIPNGVSLPVSLHTAASAVGPPPIVYVGRLEPRKDIATLLRAFALLGDERPPLWIVGDGPSRPELEQLRDDLALTSVTFSGAVSEHEKWTRLQQAACLVAPSRAGESFGIVLLEAMISGTLPIAADNPGYRDVLGAGGESLLYPPGDAEALAARIRRAVHDRPWQQAMSQWCSERVTAFTWTEIATRVESTYLRALARARA